MVAAFYAGVHLVNAYLWEVHRFEPRTHHQRQSYVTRDPVLEAVQAEYRSLAELGWAARYDPTARMSLFFLARSISNLETIKVVILAEVE